MTTWDVDAERMTTIVTGRFAYDSSGRLASFHDPRLDGADGPLFGTYAYDSSDRIVSVGEPSAIVGGSPALTPTTVAYDAGRAVTASRARPDSSGEAVQRVVYGVALSGDGLPDLTAAAMRAWEGPSVQAPATAVAVFGPDHPVAGDPGAADWPYADITGLDTYGRAVASAQYGAGRWLVGSVMFNDLSAPTWGLDSANLAAVSGAECDAAPVVCAQPSLPARATMLADRTVFDPDDPALTVDAYGPATLVVLRDGDWATSRTHAHMVFDQGAPKPLAPDTGLPWRLPTTSKASAYVLDGLADPTKIGVASANHDTEATAIGYDAVVGDVSGWKLRSATLTATDPDGGVPRGGKDPQGDGDVIVTKAVYDSYGNTTKEIQPGSDGGDAATTVAAFYGPDATGGCAGRPEWAGLECSTAMAAAPSG
ncbi:MAG: hypothetical protein U0990_12225, partial [Candidatus Nanopelagicales bacterium]|nr:hypothetical protein [Candidatus Nanopelagicales bacterium]